MTKNIFNIIPITLLFSLLLSGCGPWNSSDKTETAPVASPIELPSSAEEVKEQTKAAQSDLKGKIEKILNNKDKTFSNTIHALNDALYDFSKTTNLHYLASEISPDEGVRGAALESYLDNGTLTQTLYHNKDLFNCINQISIKGTDLSPQDKKLVEMLLLDFATNGINLGESDQDRLEEISAEVSRLEAEFQHNVTNYDHPVAFTPEELEGLPESELNLLHKTDSGTYEMDPGQLSHCLSLTTYAEQEATRKKAYVAFYSVAKDTNPEILEKIIQLKAEAAALLHFDSYADLKISTRMAKTATNAIRFLDDLSSGLRQKFLDEQNVLLEMKKGHTKNQDAVLNLWDIEFYKNRYDAENLALNSEEMKKYFSMENCLEGMLAIFEQVFAVEITEREEPHEMLWHEDVRAYQVNDIASGELLGLFYLDLYPREGKYTYFACDFTYKGNIFTTKVNEKPAGALIGNWPKPTHTTPSLLTFWDVQTLFHEFGHIMHLILMNAKYASLRNNAQDYVEIPSQMAERWCSNQEILERFAVNYQDPTDTLPADYIEKIEKSETAFSAGFILGQTSYSMTDLRLHTDFTGDDEIDVDKVYKDTAEEYYMKKPDACSGISRLTHLTGGYDAGCYSYLWSYAIVHDLETIFDNSPEGLMDRETGLKLRKEIFEPGKSRDEDECVRAFLGRDWDTDAYVRYLNGVH